MIKLIHKYKHSITIVFLFMAFCFAISGVGLDILHQGANPERDVVKVNGQKFSANDLQRSERNLEARYRQIFGDNYSELARSLRLNIRQQALDSLIDVAVLDQEAKRHGYVASDEEVADYLLNTVFKGKDGKSAFSPAAYENLQRNLGVSAAEFEKEIRDEISRSTLLNLIRDTTVVSDLDARARLANKKTTYSVTAASLSPAELAEKLQPASEAELKKFYESHATEYETQPQVSYSYTILTPKAFEKDVQVSPQDVEFHYSENIATYTKPEQYKVRAIKFFYPKEEDPAKMAAVREKAKSVREEAVAGKSFESLVAANSDDLPSKVLGGDLGWIVKSDKPTPIERAAAQLNVGDISEIIDEEYGFDIIKVEEKQPSTATPLQEVKGVIEQELRSREAPAYAANGAREIVTLAKKGDKSLAEIVQAKGLTLQETAGALTGSQDPDATLPGLTRKVLMVPTSDRLQPTILEIGDTSVVVQVKEYKDPTIPSFEQVKERVVAAYNAEAARKLASTSAEELLAAAKSSPATFDAEATRRSAKLIGPFTLSQDSAEVKDFPQLTSEIRNAVLKTDKAQSIVDRTFTTQGGVTVLKVNEIIAPNLNDPAVTKELLTYRTEARQALTKTATDSTLALLKERAKIDIDPSMMVE